MNEAKMSDVFRLPMLCEGGDGFIYSEDCRHSIRFDDTDTNCMEQKLMVTKAINSYDSNQELIKKLREQIVHERIDKHAIITNHLNVLAECIKSVPVPECDREANIKMRDAILNVMASSVAAYQVEPFNLTKKRPLPPTPPPCRIVKGPFL